MKWRIVIREVTVGPRGDTFANDEVFIIAEKASSRGEVRRCWRYESQRAKA